ncbi:MAG: sigma-70 family RNA polymerase sigma factor [Cytophagales bacterium]|nr:sigma-70 family RNA polymerase sigma factor [Cytophagales bacterium]
MEEKELLAQLRDPQSRRYAFSMLVHQYQRRVYWLVRKMVISHEDADDLTQEVFLRVWKHLDQFRQEAQLYTWIYRITSNVCLSFLEKKRRRHLLMQQALTDTMHQQLNQELARNPDEIHAQLQKALLSLPDKQRLVFNLRYDEDMSYEQIASITGTSVGALKASYHHAQKKVERWMIQWLNQ